MKGLFVILSIVVVLACSSAPSDEELARKIVQLVQQEPDRWLTVETLRNVTYTYESRDGSERITLSIRKVFPSRAVMFFPYKLEFSRDSSAEIASQFKTRRNSQSSRSLS